MPDASRGPIDGGSPIGVGHGGHHRATALHLGQDATYLVDAPLGTIPVLEKHDHPFHPIAEPGEGEPQPPLDVLRQIRRSLGSLIPGLPPDLILDLILEKPVHDEPPSWRALYWYTGIVRLRPAEESPDSSLLTYRKNL
jgi:hypothetical protein